MISIIPANENDNLAKILSNKLSAKILDINNIDIDVGDQDMVIDLSGGYYPSFLPMWSVVDILDIVEIVHTRGQKQIINNYVETIKEICGQWYR